MKTKTEIFHKKNKKAELTDWVILLLIFIGILAVSSLVIVMIFQKLAP